MTHGAATPIADERTRSITPFERLTSHAPTHDRYGLKQLGGRAGAWWRTEGLTGERTYEWIERARAGDEHSVSELVTYNEDDVRATQALRRFLRRDLWA